MSHFSNVRTQIKSKADLVECLKTLGYEVVETTQVKGYSSDAHVDFAVTPSQGDYQIGFRLHKGTYEIVADWWGVRLSNRELTEKKFRSDLLVEYAERKVRAYAQRKGFRIKVEKAQEGRQLLLVRRTYRT